MSSGSLTPDDVEAANVLFGLQDLVPAAECRDRRRLVMYLHWERRKRRSIRRFRDDQNRKGKRISPTTPFSFSPIRRMTPHKQWLEEQKHLIVSLSSTKAHLERSVEEAKRRYEMLKERNFLLKNMKAEIARKQQEQPNQQIVLDLFPPGPSQQQHTLDLNRRPEAEAEAMLARLQRAALSAEARRRRMLLQKAKSSSSHR